MAIDWSDLIRQVKEASDIVEVIGGYITLRPAGPTFKGLCPFHDDHRPSFDVDPRRQRYRCWSCQKSGDVISFIQEHERVDFREALEVLARRAGISLEKVGVQPPDSSRALMLEVARWSAEQYQHCLLDAPLGEAARKYLGERHLAGETVRRFGLGFAPPHGDWLVDRAAAANISFEMLEAVGLIAKRNEGTGFYDRFRDRLMFPIRNVRGQTVGFGGRILPTSTLLKRDPPPPKYYNSAETPLFSKSEQLYGIDQARQAGSQAGYLAVVEGYTDVLMAHQHGIAAVVATMGTALNDRHVRQLRRVVPRVVLIFDADEGGNKGVDGALKLFLSEEIDLSIATLPSGLDPCDLLVQQGSEPFLNALTNAKEVLNSKLDRLVATPDFGTVGGKHGVIEGFLQTVALTPVFTGGEYLIKKQLVISRIAQRFGIRNEDLIDRLNAIRAARSAKAEHVRPKESPPEEPKAAPAARHEVQFLEVLLGHPKLVPAAAAEVTPSEISHPGLRRMAEGLYTLQAAGKNPDLDELRPQIDNPRLMEKALEFQERGRAIPEPDTYLKKLVAEFKRLRTLPQKQEIEDRLRAAADDATAIDLLRQLQNQAVGSDS